jgi:putative aminopeptidase FrvX
MTLTPEQQNDAVTFLRRLVQASSPTGKERHAAELTAERMRALNFDRRD